jgi:hypothetical protein
LKPTQPRSVHEAVQSLMLRHHLSGSKKVNTKQYDFEN